MALGNLGRYDLPNFFLTHPNISSLHLPNIEYSQSVVTYLTNPSHNLPRMKYSQSIVTYLVEGGIFICMKELQRKLGPGSLCILGYEPMTSFDRYTTNRGYDSRKYGTLQPS